MSILSLRVINFCVFYPLTFMWRFAILFHSDKISESDLYVRERNPRPGGNILWDGQELREHLECE